MGDTLQGQDMNLLRRFLDRRKTRTHMDSERRKPTLRETDEMLSEVIADIERTASIKRTPSLIHDSPWNHVEFSSFASQCEYRYTNGSGELHAICKNPKHEAAGTGIASCNKQMCPRGKK